MRITIDLDAQTGQPIVSMPSLAAAIGQPNGLNGGAANNPGASSGPGLMSSTLSFPAQNGGAALGVEQGGVSSPMQAQDGGAAQTQGNN